jgi:Ca2+-binding EF-hand superfamily protein
VLCSAGHSNHDILHIFNSADLDRNGFIDHYEVEAALGSFGHTDEDIERIFQSMDLGGSGTIEYTEFLAATIEACSVIVDERLAEAFDRIDVDNSGYISKEDLKEFLQQGILGHVTVGEIINECDVSKSGVIMYNDFLLLWDEHEVHKMKAMSK